MEESVKKVGLKIEEAGDRTRRCESDRGGDEMYPATFGNEEKTGLKLDRKSRKAEQRCFGLLALISRTQVKYIYRSK